MNEVQRLKNLSNKRCTKWRQKHPELARTRSKESKKRNPEHYKEYNKQWEKDNPEKVKLYRKQHYLKYKNSKEHIKRGRASDRIYGLKRRKDWINEDCALCNSNINIECHHENYDLPYSIMFLCRNCHKKLSWRCETCP